MCFPLFTHFYCSVCVRLDEEVAKAGGGIVNTVAATRSASVEELVRWAKPRAKALLAEGVTTIEIKVRKELSE
jgi:imidazolonepropionase-like amidohydrolase